MYFFLHFLSLYPLILLFCCCCVFSFFDSYTLSWNVCHIWGKRFLQFRTVTSGFRWVRDSLQCQIGQRNEEKKVDNNLHKGCFVRRGSFWGHRSETTEWKCARKKRASQIIHYVFSLDTLLTCVLMGWGCTISKKKKKEKGLEGMEAGVKKIFQNLLSLVFFFPKSQFVWVLVVQIRFK